MQRTAFSAVPTKDFMHETWVRNPPAEEEKKVCLPLTGLVSATIVN